TGETRSFGGGRLALPIRARGSAARLSRASETHGSLGGRLALPIRARGSAARLSRASEIHGSLRGRLALPAPARRGAARRSGPLPRGGRLAFGLATVQVSVRCADQIFGPVHVRRVGRGADGDAQAGGPEQRVGLHRAGDAVGEGEAAACVGVG